MGRRTALAFENRVRAVREARGWSQAELARACGLSRQALSAVESGRYVPNTAVALRLAQALGCAVEDLFVPSGPRAVHAALAEPAPSGARVRLGRVRDRLVAWPLRGADAALPADGTLAGPEGRWARVVPSPRSTPPERVLLVAGCDPALRLAGELVERRTAASVQWLPLSSARALRAAGAGLVHAAGAHLRGPEETRAGPLRRWFGRAPAVVAAVARWVEGLVVRPGLRLKTPEDLLRPGVTVVNREVGSGARSVFDRWLARAGVPPDRVRGYGRELGSHGSVAEAVAGGLADAGPGVLPVARSYGLEFVPVEERRSDVVIPEDLVEWEPVQRFLEVLQDRAFRQELQSLGYDAASAGEVRALA